MKNKIINTFASIGVITVIAIACSSALSEDDDVIIPNNNNSVVVDNNTSGTTNTGTTNTSTSGTTTTNTGVQQSEIGRYQMSSISDNGQAVWVIDTASGKLLRFFINSDGTVGTPNQSPNWMVWLDIPPQ